MTDTATQPSLETIDDEKCRAMVQHLEFLGRRWVGAILLDVDHSPRHSLDPSHADLYTPDGLRRLARHLRDDGVFALWSDDPPDDSFLADLAEVFASTDAHVVEFPNPLTGGTSTNTVYVATAG